MFKSLMFISIPLGGFLPTQSYIEWWLLGRILHTTAGSEIEKNQPCCICIPLQADCTKLWLYTVQWKGMVEDMWTWLDAWSATIPHIAWQIIYLSFFYCSMEMDDNMGVPEVWGKSHEIHSRKRSVWSLQHGCFKGIVFFFFFLVRIEDRYD